MAGVAGLEPTNDRVKVCCLTAWLYPISTRPAKRKMVSPQGFEPRTHGLEGRCSIQLSYEPASLERMMRIELTPSAWKAEVLPLNYIRVFRDRECGLSGPLFVKLERKTRFELATLALARRCSTPEPLPHKWWREMDSNHRKLS